MAAWLLLMFFIFLHIKGYICLKNIINCKNEWLFLSASFTAKFELYFVLTLENNFSLRFHFKANWKSMGLDNTRDFQNSPLFERFTCFCVTISENFEHFQYFNLKIRFSGKRKLFSKNRSTVETTKTENTSFPFKTALSEANVKTNKLQNGPITKSRILPVTTLFFWKICSSFRTS